MSADPAASGLRSPGGQRTAKGHRRNNSNYSDRGGNIGSHKTFDPNALPDLPEDPDEDAGAGGSVIVVSNSGTKQANGTFKENGRFDGKKQFIKTETGSGYTYEIYWSMEDSYWCITQEADDPDDTMIFYVSRVDTQLPPEDPAKWEVCEGVQPLPRLSGGSGTGRKGAPKAGTE